MTNFDALAAQLGHQPVPPPQPAGSINADVTITLPSGLGRITFAGRDLTADGLNEMWQLVRQGVALAV